MDISDKQKYIFGSLFLLANKLQVIGDQYLGEDGMTTKQWFLTAVISQFRGDPPTLSEVAELMGSSRQNVKQLALKLEEKDFLKIQKDQQDGRVIRLKLTEKSAEFWEKRRNKDDRFLEDLFREFSEEEMDILSGGFRKLHEKIEKLEKELN